VDWAGTCELAGEQAAPYGILFAVTSRAGADLIDDIAGRRQTDGTARGFPRLQFRYCTWEHKTAPSETLNSTVDRLVDELMMIQPVGSSDMATSSTSKPSESSR
jgi:hypothetical protein